MLFNIPTIKRQFGIQNDNHSIHVIHKPQTDVKIRTKMFHILNLFVKNMFYSIYFNIWHYICIGKRENKVFRN